MATIMKRFLFLASLWASLAGYLLGKDTKSGKDD